MHGVRFAIAFTLTAAAMLTTPATAGFKAGKYTQTLFSGPDHQALNPTCITFIRTGGIVSFRSSGTWKVSDTIGGNYVADGNDLRWYGIRTDSSIVMNFYANARSGKGGFDLWMHDTSLPLSPADDGDLTLTPGCD